MYKLINRIENIQNVYTSLDNYIFVDKNDNFYLNGIKESSYKSIYFVLDGYILKQNTENKSFLYLNDTLVKEINHSYIFSTYSENGCFYYENLHYDPKDDKVKKDIYYHDFRDNSIRLFAKGFSENFQLVLDNNTITFQPRTTLKSISLITGEYEWETPINRSGEIFKILGVRDNELVVCWKRGEKLFGLLGIDIQTGVIVWNIDNNQLLNGHSLYFTDNQQSLFSTKGTNHNSYFIEIDLLSKQAIRLGEIEELCKAQVEISRSQYKDGLIYFTASTHHDIFPDIIGVLDYKTLKVLWQHRFDFDRLTHLKNFEVSEGKLYVLDSKDTLHIFEKERA